MAIENDGPHTFAIATRFCHLGMIFNAIWASRWDWSFREEFNVELAKFYTLEVSGPYIAI